MKKYKIKLLPDSGRHHWNVGKLTIFEELQIVDLTDEELEAVKGTTKKVGDESLCNFISIHEIKETPVVVPEPIEPIKIVEPVAKKAKAKPKAKAKVKKKAKKEEPVEAKKNPFEEEPETLEEE